MISGTIRHLWLQRTYSEALALVQCTGRHVSLLTPESGDLLSQQGRCPGGRTMYLEGRLEVFSVSPSLQLLEEELLKWQPSGHRSDLWTRAGIFRVASLLLRSQYGMSGCPHHHTGEVRRCRVWKERMLEFLGALIILVSVPHRRWLSIQDENEVWKCSSPLIHSSWPLEAKVGFWH